MRIKLKRGKQKELILMAKRDLTWKQLSDKLNVNEKYLCNDLKSERVLISEKLYNLLCDSANVNFDKEIAERLDENWGKSKGGLNSPGSVLDISRPEKSAELSEFVGALLGDGNLNAYKKGNKIGVYQVRIAGHIEKDKDYHLNYLKPLFEKLFGIKVNEVLHPKNNERFLVSYSLELVNFFGRMGIKPGDKIINQSTIPGWIFEKENYMVACLRGLIDTDGCIHRMSKKDPHLLRVNFTNHNRTLLEDTRKIFVRLGFKPSKIICDRVIYLSSKSDIERYLKTVGFSNQKHLCRLEIFHLRKQI